MTTISQELKEAEVWLKAEIWFSNTCGIMGRVPYDGVQKKVEWQAWHFTRITAIELVVDPKNPVPIPIKFRHEFLPACIEAGNSIILHMDTY